MTLRASHIASVFWQLLDNDGDGTPDDPAVQLMLISGKMILYVPATLTEVVTGVTNPYDPTGAKICCSVGAGVIPQMIALEEAQPGCCDTPSNRGASNTDRSTWAAAVNTSSLSCVQEKDATTEEVLHLITNAANIVYPALWGSVAAPSSGSSDYTCAAGVALKAANGNCGNGVTGDYKNPGTTGACVGTYAYDDATCAVGCLVIEGIYWASVTYMGGLYTLARAAWATNEWLMGTPD